MWRVPSKPSSTCLDGVYVCVCVCARVLFCMFILKRADVCVLHVHEHLRNSQK